MLAEGQKRGDAPGIKLREYQRRMADWILENPRCALYADMGLGKTVAVLTAIVDLFHAFDIARVLIIAPRRVALSTWPTEIRKWPHARNLTYEVLAGKTVDQRSVACMRDRSQIHIINRENVKWISQYYQFEWPYDMVVLDESDSYKSCTSARFIWLAKTLRANRVDRVVQLTGTPISLGLLDLWSQLYLLDGGRRLGYSYGAYSDRFFETNEYTGKLQPRPKAKHIIYDKLSDICLRMATKDYLTMPKCIYNTITVDFTEKQQAQYKKLETSMVLALRTGTVDAQFSASAVGKLRQFCNGAMYLDDGARWEQVHDHKMEALDSVIAEAAGNPVLVVYAFRSDKERVLARYKDSEVLDDDPETIDRWNRGEIPVLVIHPASAGHGLNLQYGGHIMAWLGLEWSPPAFQQTIARLLRQGQTHTVLVHFILVRDTLEQVMERVLTGRIKTKDELMDSLRAKQWQGVPVSALESTFGTASLDV